MKTCLKCKSNNVIMFDSNNDYCENCHEWFPALKEENDFFHTEIKKNERGFLLDIDILHNDITNLEVDAIVNAAHSHLTGGGGVDGAIHKAAGQKLLGECLALYGCPEGEARITGAYNLPAKYIIHTVGPVWGRGEESQNKAILTLANCYLSCLNLADLQGLSSIAFPCISTGAYCFPKDLAAKIAIESINEWANSYSMRVNENGFYLKNIYIVCFSKEDLSYYKNII